VQGTKLDTSFVWEVVVWFPAGPTLRVLNITEEKVLAFALTFANG
jgi:hypothetical protein